MSSWHSYPSIFAMGHKAIENLFNGPVLCEEKIDGCVSLDTPILMKDLKYVPAGLVRAGDEIIGFEDTLNDPRLLSGKITTAIPIKKTCIDVMTSEGLITVSEDHPFLVRQKTNNNGKIWVLANELKKDMSIISCGRWNAEASWESGYIAGQFDGEGSLVRSGNAGRVLSYYQKTGPELSLVAQLLKERGFSFSIDIRKRREDWAMVGALVFRASGINKGIAQILRFLGTFRPQRLLAMSEKIWVNAPLNGIGDATVISISKSRKYIVMGIGTDCHTYIANGLFSHNSQFSFGRFDGVLKVKSKGKEMIPEAPDKLFAEAVETVSKLDLIDGRTYRGEVLQKPKHNALAYDRVPRGNVILFDININEEEYLSYDEKKQEADRIGLEVVPMLYYGEIKEQKIILDMLETISVLGGQKIEGVVIKNYAEFGRDKKVLMGKYVSEAFKEVHKKTWGESNPGQNDIITRLVAMFKTPARWNKSVIHLRERGELENDPRDIGKLLLEIKHDVEAECESEIKEVLYKWAIGHIMRGVTGGFPEWYKQKLLESQFESEAKE
jgi:hypothetical protein